VVVRAGCLLFCFEDAEEEPAEGEVKVGFILEGLGVAIHACGKEGGREGGREGNVVLDK